MFTGIVDHCGSIQRVESRESSVRFEIACDFSDLVLGESISVDGCCLTVSEIKAGHFFCEVSPETLRCTIAGAYRKGRRVNLERALRLSDRLGGHLVAGHVDRPAMVKIKRSEANGDFTYLQFAGNFESDSRFLFPKGSVTVNGVSLTLNEVDASDGTDTFSVMLIPHTWQRTNLGALEQGDPVNVEFDWMTKVILQGASLRHQHIEER